MRYQLTIVFIYRHPLELKENPMIWTGRTGRSLSAVACFLLFQILSETTMHMQIWWQHNNSTMKLRGAATQPFCTDKRNQRLLDLDHTFGQIQALKAS